MKKCKKTFFTSMPWISGWDPSYSERSFSVVHGPVRSPEAQAPYSLALGSDFDHSFYYNIYTFDLTFLFASHPVIAQLYADNAQVFMQYTLLPSPLLFHHNIHLLVEKQRNDKTHLRLQGLCRGELKWCKVIQVTYNILLLLVIGWQDFVYSALAMKLRSSLSGSTKLCCLCQRSYFLMTVGGIKAMVGVSAWRNPILWIRLRNCSSLSRSFAEVRSQQAGDV